MYSANIQRLLNIDPIRPPSRNERSKRPQSITSLKSNSSFSRFPSFKDTFYISSNYSSKTQTMKIADLKDEYDIGDDEPASMKVPCASIDPLDKENIDTRVETGQDVVATVSTTAVSKFSKKPSFTRSSYDENKTPLAESFCNQSLHVTSLGKPTDVKIMSFGPKHYSQQFVTNNSTESFERVNPITTLHHNEDLYASLQNQLKFKTSVEGYTLESQEGRLIHHQHMSSLESQPILIQSVLQECDEKQLMMQNPQSPEKTIKPTEMAKSSTPIHLRGQSQAVLQEECNNITKHHRFTSDTNFGIL